MTTAMREFHGSGIDGLPRFRDDLAPAEQPHVEPRRAPGAEPAECLGPPILSGYLDLLVRGVAFQANNWQ